MAAAARKPGDSRETGQIVEDSWLLQKPDKTASKNKAASQLDWLLHPWYFSHNPVARASWWAGATYVVGSIIVTVGGFASASSSMRPDGAQGRDLYAWLVLLPFFTGSCLFTASSWLLVLLALNSGYDQKLEQWVYAPPAITELEKPRFVWFGCKPRSASWWVGVLYLAGAALYVLGTSTGLSSLWTSAQSIAAAQELVGVRTFVAGGVLFFLGGCVDLAQAGATCCNGRRVLEEQQCTAQSYNCWTVWLAFWGDVGFCVAGLLVPWRGRLADSLLRWSRGVGFGGGAICFLAAGLVMLAELSVEQALQREAGDRLEGASPLSVDLAVWRDSLDEPTNAVREDALQTIDEEGVG